MMEQVINIVGALLGVAFVTMISIVTPKLKMWLATKIDANEMACLEQFIDAFVKAADQIYKTVDPDGSIRNDYVKTQLKNLGYVISAEVDAMIEAKVFELPKTKNG